MLDQSTVDAFGVDSILGEAQPPDLGCSGGCLARRDRRVLEFDSADGDPAYVEHRVGSLGVATRDRDRLGGGPSG